MEPNKIENQIREKLEAREIKPSEQSWDRLNAMLSVREEKKTRNGFPWLSVAAGFLILFGLGYFIVNQNKEKEIDFREQPSVVEINQESNKSASEDIIKGSENNTVISAVEIGQVGLASDKESEQKNNKQSKKILTENHQIIALESSSDDKIEIAESGKSNVVKIEESDTENLLAQVEKNKALPKNKVKIDAKDLLSQVDGEIELTFRQKVMRTIKKNYQETKVAISTRNQESSINH